MQTENKPIRDWLEDIRRGVVRLPRFQRGEAWTYMLIESFLNTVILHDWPIGVLLTLEVDSNDPPFETRPLEGTVNNGEKCKTHLLDGQQRLTALWRALNDNYSDRIYFIIFSEENGEYKVDPDNGIKSIPKNTAEPWIKEPAEAFSKNLMPISLLNPSEPSSSKIDAWLKYVTDKNKKDKLKNWVLRLMVQISSKPFPSLPLPQSTTPDDAIDIFIKTNSSYARLTPYNIAVARFEAKTQESLQKLVDNIGQKVSGIVDLEGEDGLGDLVLKVACLFQGMMPTYGNYKKLNMKELQNRQGEIQAGVQWATDMLNEQNIWHERHLPSSVPLRVLPALFEYMPKPRQVQLRAKANRLVREYIWRAFVTDRYDRQSNDRLKKDYDALKNALETKSFTCSDENTIFTKQLPDKEELLSEGWPKSRGIRKRAILAICNREGAKDVASGGKISSNKILKRQYHHIFPKGLFRKMGCNSDPNLALNCMLIEEDTNKDWNDSWPGEYLLQIIKETGLTGKKAKTELSHRLISHLIPSDTILKVVKADSTSLQNKYDDFLQQRAELVIEKMKKLCSGETG